MTESNTPDGRARQLPDATVAQLDRILRSQAFRPNCHPEAGVTVAYRRKEKADPLFRPTQTLPSLGWYAPRSA